MKTLKSFLLIAALAVVFSVGLSYTEAKGQCAMCSLNAENSTKNGNTVGKGLNKGVLFLLGMPFFIVTGAGVLWYTKFKKKEEKTPVL